LFVSQFVEKYYGHTVCGTVSGTSLYGSTCSRWRPCVRGICTFVEWLRWKTENSRLRATGTMVFWSVCLYICCTQVC